MNDVEAMQRAFQLYLHFKKRVEARQYEALIRLPAQQEPKHRGGERRGKRLKRAQERHSLADSIASSGKTIIKED